MPQKKQTSVLVVDDEPLLVKTIARFLERQGCRVTVCRDGAGAMNCLAADTFDVVITDLELPGVHGRDIADYVRKRHPSSRLALISAHSQDDAPGKSKKSNIHLLQKPFDLRDLLPLLPRRRRP